MFYFIIIIKTLKVILEKVLILETLIDFININIFINLIGDFDFKSLIYIRLFIILDF